MGVDVEWQEFFHDNLRYADIINGKKAFALNAQGYADYQGVQVTNFTVTK